MRRTNYTANRDNFKKVAEERGKEVKAKYQEFAEKYLPDFPSEVQSMVWHRAFDEGHASGWVMVDALYEMDADFIKRVLELCSQPQIRD